MEHLREVGGAVEKKVGVEGLIGGPLSASPNGSYPVHCVKSVTAVDWLIGKEVDFSAKDGEGRTAFEIHAAAPGVLSKMLEYDCSCVDTTFESINGTMMHHVCELMVVDSIAALHKNYARIAAADVAVLLRSAYKAKSITPEVIIKIAEWAIKLPNNPKDAVPCVRSDFR